MNNINPFRAYRAEQLGNVAWKYFIREPFDSLISEKPLVFEGGRGSGKTMFFLCNSWEERINELESKGESPLELLKRNSFVGIYYKADSTFISGFNGKGLSQDLWDSLFNTYFNLIICKDFIKFLHKCNNLKLTSELELENLSSNIYNKLKVDSTFSNLQLITKQINSKLNIIEEFSNNPDPNLKVKINWLSPGSLINLLIENLKQLPAFQDTTFHIFIDEYETLNINQQKAINTLLKTSRRDLVYDISVKTKGIKTFNTIGSEIIQSPHDFKHYKPELQLDDSEYEKLLWDICEKRFKESFTASNENSDYADINYYLGKYDFKVEVGIIEKSGKSYKFKERLTEIIAKKTIDKKNIGKFTDQLVNNGSIINHRMHLALLLRSGSNKITVETLFEEYTKWLDKKSKRYEDWYSNMKYAVLYLLSNELNIPKMFFGTRMYVMLSSKIIRYFLELCEQAFDFAIMNNFDANNPRKLTIDEQTRAARYVGRHKVIDTEDFKPNGKILRRFVELIGKIFLELQTNSNLTLGEVEQNHFYTNPTSLDPQTIQFLDNAIMHNVLQVLLPTKDKEAELSVETVDYHINHIYCSYFRISPRRKNKIFISPHHLKTLFCGTELQARKAALDILSGYKALKSVQINQDSFEAPLFEVDIL